MKGGQGRYFEDFQLDEDIIHPIPRTVSQADATLYTALTGARFAVNAADDVAQGFGYSRAPIDDVLAFHLVFGKTVPDVSLNAIANLGYAEGRFHAPLFPGDMIRAQSTVIGRRPNKDGKTGIVWVHSRGFNRLGGPVIEFKRWVMVRRRTTGAFSGAVRVPDLPSQVAAADLKAPPGFKARAFDPQITGETFRWGDYEPGERIDHRAGITIDEAEHQMATRLFHNTARVHFDRLLAERGRFGKRIIYGGYVISLARALTITGLANAQHIIAINGGRHTAPTFADDTIFAWSEVLARIPLPSRTDVGALRLRTVAVKNIEAASFPDQTDEGADDPAKVLELDYTVVIPK